MEMRELLDRLYDADHIVLRRIGVPHSRDAVKEWGDPEFLSGEELYTRGVYWDTATMRGRKTIATSTEYTQWGGIITIAQTL